MGLVSTIAVEAGNFIPTIGDCLSDIQVGPFRHGTDTYVILVDKFAHRVRVAKSVDGGATWAVLAALGPTLYQNNDGIGQDLAKETVATVQEGDNLRIFYRGLGVDGVTGLAGTIATTTFSMNTDTWSGVVVDSGVDGYSVSWNFVGLNWFDSGSFYEPLLAIRNSAGDCIIFYNGIRDGAGFIGTSGRNRAYYMAWTAGAFVAPVPMTATGTADSSWAQTLVEGSLGSTHLIYRNDTPALWQRTLDAVFVLNAASLAAATVDNGGTAPGHHPYAFGAGGANLLIPYTSRVGGTTRSSVLEGVSGVAPVFTTDVGDSLVAGDANPDRPVMVVDQGLCLFMVIHVNSAGQGLGASLYSVTRDAGGVWSGRTLIYNYGALQFGTYGLEQYSAIKSGATTIDLVSSNYRTRGFLAPLPTAVTFAQVDVVTACAPVPPAPVVVPQNQGSRRMVVLVPNKFDLCLSQDLQIHQLYHPRKVCCEPMLWQNINWIRAPKDFIPFRKTAAIPTPLPGADNLVLAFQVPHGYDGVIAGLFQHYTGPGFQEGNGDIEWRLLVNRTYAIHLGDVLVSLGSQQQCYPLDGGIFIQSGTWIQYLVNVPNLSGGILPINSQIVCGLEGLFYARS